MTLDQLKAAFDSPLVRRLREINNAEVNVRQGNGLVKRKQYPRNSKERFAAMKPLVAEFVAFMHPYMSGTSLSIIAGGLKLACTLTGKSEAMVPKEKMAAGWVAFRDKLNTDGKFLGRLYNDLPEIAGRYDSNSMLGIVSDQQFQALLQEAARK